MSTITQSIRPLYSALKRWYDSGWEVVLNEGDVFNLENFGPGDECGYGYNLSATVTVSSCSISTRLAQDSTVTQAEWTCSVYSGSLEPETLIQSKTVTRSQTGDQEFRFTGLNVPASTLFFIFSVNITQHAASYSPNCTVSPAAASVTYTLPTLSVNVSPAELYTGGSVNVSFTGRIEQTLSVQFLYNSVILHEASASADSISVTCSDSWFGTAGIAGNSMSVKVRASDSLGRTSSDATFTLKRAVGGSISPVAPRSTTVDGANTINFAWTYSGDGTLAKTELQWSQDNAAWSNLATITGSGTSWTAPSVKFPGGTIYWRARATNSYGLVGNWSSSVSFTAAYYSTSQVAPTSAPTSGIINAQQARSFAVALLASGPVYEPFTIASATFFWRGGTSGTWTEVAMTASGSGASVTIPAGIFPSGVIQWKASATDNTGRTTETAEYTLTTLNADIDAAPLSPINLVASGSSPIVFRWSYGSIDGSAQSKAELQFSANGTSWEDPVVVPGGETSYTAPPNTFNGGTVYWRVRAYNGSNTAGPWSAAVSFVVFAAPIVRGVTGTDKPFSTISWQVEGQAAYKIEVDGKLFGPYFGEDVRSFDLPEPLSDGLHTVRVAAQNQYGLWSEWAEAQVLTKNVSGPAFSVQEPGGVGKNIGINYFDATPAPQLVSSLPTKVQKNSGNFMLYAGNRYPAKANYQWEYRVSEADEWITTGANLPALTVSVSSSYNGRQYRCRVYNAVGEVYTNVCTFIYASPEEIAPVLSINNPAPTGFFLIFRDGIPIAKTYLNNFTDRVVLGTHDYFVVQVLAGGYYTKSNTVTVTAAVDSPMIAPLAGGDFLALKLSESANRSQTIKRAQEVAYTQYAGAMFPEAELGEHESLSVSGDVSYLYDQAAEAAAFEALMGKPVIYKTPGGACVVGVLEGFQRRDPLFFKSYSFNVTQMEWRDYVDATDSL